MKCENIQFNLSLYADNILTDEEREAVETHLAQCPLCRQKRDDFQALRQNLRQALPSTMPKNLLASVKNAMAAELEIVEPKRESVFSEGFLEFLQMRIMPYAVGTAASLILGFSLLWLLLSGINGKQQNPQLAQFPPVQKSTVLLANSNPKSNLADGEINPVDFVAERFSVSVESPSVNPQGALVALSNSFTRGKMKDNEVVVVADVFSNGLANIEEVVEPLDDEQTVYELEQALNNNATNAPFVPSFLDRRADSVRVVFKIQRVDVSTSQPKAKRR
jgi:negative regulator of sigma E activity